MPITTIDPTAALVVIDLQKGVLGLDTQPHTASQVLERSVRLAEAFRRSGRTVVLVNVDGAPTGRTDIGPRRHEMPADFADFPPALSPVENDLTVTKKSQGVFTTTDLDSRLRARGVTQLVFTGIATGSGVESSVRQAFELGYHVATVTDAVADRSVEVHDFVLATVFPRVSETGTTADVLALLSHE